MPLQFFIANGSPIAMTTRYRCLHLSEQLRRLGHEAEIVDWSDETKIDPQAPLRCDVIVLYRLMLSPALERLIIAARRLGKPVIFDTDDLIFEPSLIPAHRAVTDLSAPDQKLYAEGVGRYLRTLLACDLVLTSTPVLAELARERGKKAFVHRNSLGEEMQALADRLYATRAPRGGNERVVIGYGSGTHTHDVDFAEADAALVHLLQRFHNVELWLAGPLTISRDLEGFGERVRRLPLTDWIGWFELTNRMDIALAPLERGNIFCRAKSEIKFVEAGALGVPIVGSTVDPYDDSITPGEDGLLAANERDWIEALAFLIENPERRKAMGARARETVLQRYSPKARTVDLALILPELTNAHKGRARRSVVAKRPVEATSPTDVPLLMNWIVPEPSPGAGGDIGLFRLTRHLAEFGHECNVYVVHYELMNDWTTEDIRAYISKHFGPTRARYHRWTGRIGDADCTFATFWPTVESLLPLPNGGKRYYLVQDWEPIFYPDHQEHRERAEMTYHAGLHCITLGPWVARVLEERYGVHADYFDFAIDDRIYRPRLGLRGPVQRVCFYARSITPRRAYEVGIKALQLVKARLPEVEIELFGAAELSPAPPPGFVNRGMLGHDDLAKLFSSCDAGLVFSLTNPSFVPLEMMACGCAVVELASERFEGILTHAEDAWLVELDPETVAQGICRLLEDHTLRDRLVANGLSRTRTMSWRKSVRQIESIVLKDVPESERILGKVLSAEFVS